METQEFKEALSRVKEERTLDEGFKELLSRLKEERINRDNQRAENNFKLGYNNGYADVKRELDERHPKGYLERTVFHFNHSV